MEAWREYLTMITTGRSIKESKKPCPCPDLEGGGSGGDCTGIGDCIIELNFIVQ